MSKSYEQFRKNLQEGTLSVPTTKAKWNNLQKIMTKKLPVGDSESNDKKVWSKSAGHRIYNLVGDDKLADDLDMLEKKGPDTDARPVILQWLKRNGFDIKKKDGYKSASWSHPGRKGPDWSEEVEYVDEDIPDYAKDLNKKNLGTPPRPSGAQTWGRGKTSTKKKKVKKETVEINPEVAETYNYDNSRIVKMIKGSMRVQRLNEGQEKEVSRYLEKKGFDDYDFWFKNGLQVTDQATGKQVITSLKKWDPKVYGKAKIGKASKDAKHGAGFSVSWN